MLYCTGVQNHTIGPQEEPIIEEGVEGVAGEAAVTGTDASGWGAGQLAWIDGGREEVQLEFTSAEQRRPINWRELLGILRVFEHFGARLRGRLVLVETDNMSAKGAAEKRASKAEDSQELVRRLLEVCEEHDIELRVCHTPGALLHRPDQTSRGDPVEEPRMRLCAAAYGELAARFGPFTEWIGAERRHARVGCLTRGRGCRSGGRARRDARLRGEAAHPGRRSRSCEPLP